MKKKLYAVLACETRLEENAYILYIHIYFYSVLAFLGFLTILHGYKDFNFHSFYVVSMQLPHFEFFFM